MKIHDRYLLGEFLTYLALGLAGFIAIFIVVDIFEKIDVFLDHRAPIHLILRFYLYRAPEVVVQVLPVALLLATFLGLGQLNKFGELTAMRVSGLSVLRILVPVFAIAALSALGALFLSECVVPPANRERDLIYDEQIQHLRREAMTERADVTYLGQGGRIFYVRLYLANEKRMHEVSLQEFRRGELVRRVDAAEANWDGHRWIFSSGFLRTFEGGVETAQPFERLKASGARVANYLVDLHLKLAFPLINFIIVMIGASLATRLRAQSAAVGFGLSVAISFLYYAFMRTGQALGHNGALPPYLAAWLGDLVFGVFGIGMMVQAQRR